MIPSGAAISAAQHTTDATEESQAAAEPEAQPYQASQPCQAVRPYDKAAADPTLPPSRALHAADASNAAQPPPDDGLINEPDDGLIDEAWTVPDDASFKASRVLARTTGALLGGRVEVEVEVGLRVG